MLCKFTFRILALVQVLLLGSISGCRSCDATRCKISEFVAAVRTVNVDADRDTMFKLLKERLKLKSDCSNEISECADDSAGGEPAKYVLTVTPPSFGKTDGNKFVAALHPLNATDLRVELNAVLGNGDGIDYQGSPAYIINQGLLSLDAKWNTLDYRSPAATGNPLDYVETRVGVKVPLDTDAISYIQAKAVRPTNASIVADFEKRNPFHFQLQVTGKSGWLVTPEPAGPQGLSVLYIGPINQADQRMTGIIMQFAVLRKRDFDTNSVVAQLRSVLLGMGFEDVDGILRAAPVTFTPTPEYGVVTGFGNLLIAHHYNPEATSIFKWYSIAIFRRVALPPDLRQLS